MNGVIKDLLDKEIKRQLEEHNFIASENLHLMKLNYYVDRNLLISMLRATREKDTIMVVKIMMN